MYRILRVAQPLMISVLGVMLVFWGSVSSLIPWARRDQILGVTIAIGAGIVLYFESLLLQIARREQERTHTSLTEALKLAFAHAGRPRIVRVYAFSTHLIQPVLRDMGVNVRQCMLLLYNYVDKPGSTSDSFDLTPVREWCYMKNDGHIAELDIYLQPFYPTEYFVLIDERALVAGHYLLEDNRHPRCEVQDPFFVSDDTGDGKVLIRKYLALFDRLRCSKQCQKLDLEPLLVADRKPGVSVDSEAKR